MDEALLLWGLLFGSIGFGLFLYGKRQNAIVALVCGLGLILLPFLIFDSTLIVIIGVVLIAIPCVVRR